MDAINLKWELIENPDPLASQQFAVVDYNGYTVIDMTFCDPAAIRKIVSDHNNSAEVQSNYIEEARQ